MNIIIPGQYPRSEALVAATRQFDRKQLTAERLKVIIKKDEEDFKNLQSDFAYRSTGLFQWQDLLRPFVEIIDGAESGSLKRFYETNLFWRELKCAGKWQIKSTLLDEWINKWFLPERLYEESDPMIFTLPFLYLFRTFAKVSLNDAATIIKIVAERLTAFCNKALCFIEPTIGWKQLTEEEKKIGISLLKEIRKSARGPVFFCTAFFSIENEKDFLYELPVDGIGIDFFANSTKVLKQFPTDQILLAGVLRTDSTSIETPEQLNGFMKVLGDEMNSESLYFMPSGIAELLPRVTMDAKLEALKEFACNCIR